MCRGLYNDLPSCKKSICTSRSFAKKIANLKSLEEAISYFVSITVEKLRKQQIHTNFITVFISTSYHTKDVFYSNSCQITLPNPTSYTPTLITYAKKGLNKIFKRNFLYKKADIILSNFTHENLLQLDFFSKSNQ